MEKVTLKATARKVITKAAKNNLRREGKVPGIYYSKHDEPIAIEISEKIINPLVYTTDTHLISLEIEGSGSHDCVIKDVQFDPLTDKIVHFDLQGLTSGEKFQLEVPIQYTGSPIGVKEGGVLQTFLHKLDIECLPADIPQHVKIGIQDLKIGDAIHISDLNLEGITILNPEDSVIISVTHPKAEKEEVPAEGAEEEAAEEPEVIGKEKSEEE